MVSSRTHKKDTARAPGHEARAIALSLAVCLALALLWFTSHQAMATLTARATPTPPIYRVAAQHNISPFVLSRGRQTFVASCAVCHGPSGKGIPRLGKPLRNNAFVQDLSDDELVEFIANGRLPTDPENTTGVAMPARAGNPKLTDAILADVVTYLRTMQDPDAPTVSMDQWIAAAAQDGAGAVTNDNIGAVGHDAFVASCSACHGPSGEGLPGLGKPLATSTFVADHSDEELMAFVKRGRPIWDPENTTGIDMPPKGGNPALSDDQLKDIIAYIRTLHDQAN